MASHNFNQTKSEDNTWSTTQKKTIYKMQWKKLKVNFKTK